MLQTDKLATKSIPDLSGVHVLVAPLAVNRPREPFIELQTGTQILARPGEVHDSVVRAVQEEGMSGDFYEVGVLTEGELEFFDPVSAEALLLCITLKR